MEARLVIGGDMDKEGRSGWIESEWNAAEVEARVCECLGELACDEVVDVGSLDGGVTTTLNMTVADDDSE